jgi:hypothetical protein
LVAAGPRLSALTTEQPCEFLLTVNAILTPAYEVLQQPAVDENTEVEIPNIFAAFLNAQYLHHEKRHALLTPEGR